MKSKLVRTSLTTTTFNLWNATHHRKRVTYSGVIGWYQWLTALLTNHSALLGRLFTLVNTAENWPHEGVNLSTPSVMTVRQLRPAKNTRWLPLCSRQSVICETCLKKGSKRLDQQLKRSLLKGNCVWKDWITFHPHLPLRRDLRFFCELKQNVAAIGSIFSERLKLFHSNVKDVFLFFI